MKYMLLICADPSTVPTTPEQGLSEVTAKYMAFNTETQASGEWISGDRLYGVETATCVRVNDGQMLVTDGPFVETKEHLGGYYVVDVADLDRALELAAKLPAAATGVVEVRPIWEL